VSLWSNECCQQLSKNDICCALVARKLATTVYFVAHLNILSKYTCVIKFNIYICPPKDPVTDPITFAFSKQLTAIIDTDTKAHLVTCDKYKLSLLQSIREHPYRFHGQDGYHPAEGENMAIVHIILG
jgi:hypothetical protein